LPFDSHVPLCRRSTRVDSATLQTACHSLACRTTLAALLSGGLATIASVVLYCTRERERERERRVVRLMGGFHMSLDCVGFYLWS
jgi:hypothetical protein